MDVSFLGGGDYLWRNTDFAFHFANQIHIIANRIQRFANQIEVIYFIISTAILSNDEHRW